MDKLEVARRLLGTALDMFIREQDPVSVHCLAMAGGEISEQLATKAGGDVFVNHIRATFPEKQLGEIRNIQRMYYNAFKHAATRNGEERKDSEILEHFDANVNDHTLFVGWYDFMGCGLPTPVEVQVFMAWYAVKYSDKVRPDVDLSDLEHAFPGLRSLPPRRQHDGLREMIETAKREPEVMEHEATDRRPLVLPWG